MILVVMNKVGKVSNRFHPAGGLVVIARSLTEAFNLCDEDSEVEVKAKDWVKAHLFELDPCHDKLEPRIFKFPDAGCC